MWLLFGLMGTLMASAMVDSSLRDAEGTTEDDDDDGLRPPIDSWLDDWRDDSFISSDGDPPDDDPGDDPPGDDPPVDDRPPIDPWLDDWRDDSFISSDGDLPDDDPGDDPPGDDPPDDDPPVDDRPPIDPWLDEQAVAHFGNDQQNAAPAALMDDASLRVMGTGERVMAGGGGVYVLGGWVDAAEPAVIEGFRPGADQLVYAHLTEAGEPELGFADAPDTVGTALLVDGQPILLFEGGTPPPLDAVELFAVSLGTVGETQR